MQIFMADYNTFFSGGLGILSWALNANGVAASNDLGTVDVTLTNNPDLAMSPYAVSVDTNGDIYTIQDVQDMYFMDATNDPNPRVLCFPPAPSGGPPDATSIWNIGSGDPTLINTYGIAVDRSATFVAAASRGYGTQPDALQQGGVSIFLAASGTLVTNISQDLDGSTNQEMVDVAWDNVGNLYANDFSDSVWRVYSPPGPNQATTVAVPIIQVYNALTPPQLSVPTNCMGQINFTLTGQSNVTYVIQQSPDLMNWTPIATNLSLTAVLPVSVSPPDTQDFYRAVTSP
jgi:hypothetical protein